MHHDQLRWSQTEPIPSIKQALYNKCSFSHSAFLKNTIDYNLELLQKPSSRDSFSPRSSLKFKGCEAASIPNHGQHLEPIQKACHRPSTGSSGLVRLQSRAQRKRHPYPQAAPLCPCHIKVCGQPTSGRRPENVLGHPATHPSKRSRSMAKRSRGSRGRAEHLLQDRTFKQHQNLRQQTSISGA